jgi:uncharacterized membrane protein
MPWTHFGPTVLASFLASLVECVEAFTVVLAVGAVRGWRPALAGTAAALLVLLALVGALGGSLASMPIRMMRRFIGALVLLFGFRWLRKAILRSAGILRLHDEEDVYRRSTLALRTQPRARTAWDRMGLVAAFEIVLLEGVEVVFIVLAIGADGDARRAAAAGALGALACVVLLGAALHRPLSKIPENALKFVVAVLLAAFGSVWVGEGLGFERPAGDVALPVTIAVYFAVAAALAALCRRAAAHRAPGPAAEGNGGRPSAAPPDAASVPAWRRAPAALLHLFVDDGWLAAGTIGWLAASAVLLPPLGAHPLVQWSVFVLGLVALLGRSAMDAARHGGFPRIP